MSYIFLHILFLILSFFVGYISTKKEVIKEVFKKDIF